MGRESGVFEGGEREKTAKGCQWWPYISQCRRQKTIAVKCQPKLFIYLVYTPWLQIYVQFSEWENVQNGSDLDRNQTKSPSPDVITHAEP